MWKFSKFFSIFVLILHLLRERQELSFSTLLKHLFGSTVALRFWRALRASVLYGTEAHKAQKIIGDTVSL